MRENVEEFDDHQILKFQSLSYQTFDFFKIS